MKISRINFLLNSIIIFLVNIGFGVLVFNSYIYDLLIFNLNVPAMVFTICFVILFLSQVLILIAGKEFNKKEYKNSFIFSYVSLFGIVWAILVEGSLSDNNSPSIAPLIVMAVPIFIWFICVLVAWFNLIKGFFTKEAHS
ncbi:MAG: hypothetical protein NTW11_00965 [Candidatus Staskawiczbacteria bacterium]|nr:hypothetical protein [Candidatus Staskawiczbacteria bacterium]